jgi:hypothetical protein
VISAVRGIELGLQEIRIADADPLLRVQMNEGEVAKDDEPIPTRLGRAHERKFEGLEDVAEGQVEIDRLDRADHVRFALRPGEPA